MNKMPWFKFYPADWVKGTRALTNKEKGVWMDLLCYMWENKERGQITADWESLARMVGLEWLECEGVIRNMSRRGLFEIVESENLTEPNRNLTLISRRMERDENTRESNRLRQKKHYHNAQPNANLTDKKSEVRSQRENILPSRLPEEDGKPTPQNLFDLWNKEAHPNLPRAKFLTEGRKRQAVVRLRENSALEFWEDVLLKVNRSPLLRGETGNWKASFDWILNPTNLAKIVEGTYDPVKR